MTSLVERLRELSTNMLKVDLDMRLPAGSIDPAEAADRIESLERENAKLRRTMVNALANSREARIAYSSSRLQDEIKRARCKALEEAAEVVDSISHDGLHGSMWEQKFRAAATAIRALSVSSPTPLQEQNANSGKEVG